MSRNIVIPVEDRLALKDRRKFDSLDDPMHLASGSLPYLIGLRDQMELDIKTTVNKLEDQLYAVLPKTDVGERLAANYAISTYFAQKVSG